MSEQIESDFKCPKCNGRGGLSRMVALADRVILPLNAVHYRAVSCRLCGYTEFYSIEAPVDAEAVREASQAAAPEQTRPA